MRVILIAFALAAFALAVTSCGGREPCDEVADAGVDAGVVGECQLVCNSLGCRRVCVPVPR